jgi:hypothetical protein
MTDIQLPYLWRARHYQQEVFRYMFKGGSMERKRACCVWHRRCGKDSFSLQLGAIGTQERVGTYWHMLPTLNQARKVVWDGIDKEGRRMIDQAFPKELRESTNESDMKIKFKNGSVWQCVGSDNYDSLVGTNPVGVVMSEYSVADPRAWDFIRPILSENGGWAVFIYTPRGKNHGYRLYQNALESENWFCSLLTIEDTFRDDARTQPVITKEDYLDEINSGMDPQLAAQEYMCSFDAGLFGAYYTEQLKMAKVGDYPWNPNKPVHTFWDLGLRDATAIWFAQESNDGDAINVIDYWEESNVPLVDWMRRIREAPYTYGVHVGPHDIKRRDYTTGKSYLSTAAEMGVDFEVCPDIGLRQGIDASKSFLPRVRFNADTTSKGYDALVNYRREYNDKLQVFMDRPLHDWASHGADAFRVMSIAWPEGWSMGDIGNYGVIRSNGTRTTPRRRGRFTA